ncbi:DUF397 domain-containing protein [Streptomyces tsukubensis]|uniref:DUF397 domain-containing protein n=1 Tax=Streptomyces tsukubensis TaxID=83656 RepID=A0A1V4A6T7_9ACTN|nr:DUF397 domain-containing protein [Streptomyces tsukubensis]OON77299.1 DUF397 domain-containing protein [Streptomyces tsukubensis]QFR92374.1 DUF397 domain-containing protein [Streptomyces tsukubensis]
MTIDCYDRSAGLKWFKSTYSGSGGGNCVEVAVAAQAVHVRDSKDRPGPQLVFEAVTWAGFLEFTAAR